MELHVVFSYSAAGSIRQILTARETAVARFSDNLSCGPIDSLQSSTRRAWLDHNLGYDDPNITSDEEAFWPKVLKKEVSRIAWVSRRSAYEYCGFLEYMRRLGDLPTQIIDTTGAKDDNGELFRGTASIPANHILAGLLDTAYEVGEPFRSESLALWQKLRAENSELRVVDQKGTLSSVALSFYDQQLLSLVTQDWQSMAFVVGSALVDGAENDSLLFSRMYSLVDSGVLTSRESGRRFPDVKLVSA